MAISTDSIIHYTGKFETLKNIIQVNGLKISYCVEKVITRGSKNYSFAFPMVSFCDIPISDYKKHFYKQKGRNLGYYGDYGIGLSKKWAVNNGLNPVLYIDSNSFTGTALRKSVELIANSKQVDKDLPKRIPSSTTEPDDFLQFALFAKNYQGDLYRKDKLEQKRYRFYDEREWRFVPKSKDINGNEIVLNSAKYDENIDEYKARIEGNYLKFESKDISYIIVKDSAEIKGIIDVIKTTFRKDENVDVLISKVISSEQILSDF